MRFNSRTPGGVRQVWIKRVAKHRRFNSRTPGGVRLTTSISPVSSCSFQFTHPGRGATCLLKPDALGVHVSIHAPREGCDLAAASSAMACACVSIHAPREGCDIPKTKGSLSPDVSIHAPREGCDRRTRQRRESTHSFNSRTPGGVRLIRSALAPHLCSFQFTHPGRGATVLGELHRWGSVFQFTHPGRGATPYPFSETRSLLCFNSRTPGGVRPGLDAS